MKNKAFKVGLLLLVAGLISCDGSQQTSDNIPTEHKVKSVDFKELKLTELTPKAQEDLRQWKNFQSLMQIIISMAPNKIKNTDALVLSNPDSLLIYSRLHPISSKTESVNTLVERDWRTPPNSIKDTVFRVEKIKEENKKTSKAKKEIEKYSIPKSLFPVEINNINAKENYIITALNYIKKNKIKL